MIQLVRVAVLVKQVIIYQKTIWVSKVIDVKSAMTSLSFAVNVFRADAGSVWSMLQSLTVKIDVMFARILGLK